MTEWKAVDGTSYLVSDDGRVMSTKRKVPHILQPDATGPYQRVTLYEGGETQRHPVHRLVAKVFLSNPSEKPYVNHIDGDKMNNRATNLEWCTCSENTIHAFELGLNKSTEEHGNTTRDNKTIHRVCKMIEEGHIRGSVLKAEPTVSKSCFDDIRSRRAWVRISQHYRW